MDKGVHRYQKTAKVLSERLSGARSLRALAKELDEKPGTLSAILNEYRRGYSLETENRVRGKLGLEPLPCPVEVPPCPDCGQIHVAERCGGRTGEVRIVRPPRPNRRWASVSRVPRELADVRRHLGVSWREVIEAGLHALSVQRSW